MIKGYVEMREKLLMDKEVMVVYIKKSFEYVNLEIESNEEETKRFNKNAESVFNI